MSSQCVVGIMSGSRTVFKETQMSIGAIFRKALEYCGNGSW